MLGLSMPVDRPSGRPRAPRTLDILNSDARARFQGRPRQTRPLPVITATPQAATNGVLNARAPQSWSQYGAFPGNIGGVQAKPVEMNFPIWCRNLPRALSGSAQIWSMPDMHRYRQNFGRTRPAIGRIWGNHSQRRWKSTKMGPEFARHKSTEFGRIRQDFGRSWPDFGHASVSSTILGPIPEKLDLLAKVWPILGRCWPNWDHCLPKLVKSGWED